MVNVPSINWLGCIVHSLCYIMDARAVHVPCCSCWLRCHISVCSWGDVIRGVYPMSLAWKIVSCPNHQTKIYGHIVFDIWLGCADVHDACIFKAGGFLDCHLFMQHLVQPICKSHERPTTSIWKQAVVTFYQQDMQFTVDAQAGYFSWKRFHIIQCPCSDICACYWPSVAFGRLIHNHGTNRW